MRKLFLSKCIFLFLLTAFQTKAQNAIVTYPSFENRRLSPGHTTYYIDPKSGNDLNRGTNPTTAWKTFHPVNKMVLSSGDMLEILCPGDFNESLVLVGKGTEASPIHVKFASGNYNLYPHNALYKLLHISNTNNRPYEPKGIALFFDSCRFVNVTGKGAKFILRGKLIETYISNSSDISIDGLSFDYYRPTVSEIKVTEMAADYADVQIHKDSKYNIHNNVITWLGEGWSYQPGYYWQIYDPETKHLARIEFKMEDLKFIDVGNRKVRIYFTKNPGFKKGFIYQNRDITRDCVGMFLQSSKNVSLRNIRLYFMHGMGIVSQLSENISINHVVVKPDESSGRTCAAWADILHFSGCKGKIEIANSYLSGANDDAINIHGVHLKITQIISPNQVVVEYMHHETFGFNPYQTGDSLDFIGPETLLPIGSNIVQSTIMVNDKQILIFLKMPIAAGVRVGDAIENTTATPEIFIQNNTISSIPTRGMLVTSRRKTVIEDNELLDTHMTAILINDDASYWYESGMVREVLIRNNKFNWCGEPAIDIHPENTEDIGTPVHSGISIIGNTFNLRGSRLFAAKSTSGIIINGNAIFLSDTQKKINDLIELKNCLNVDTSANNIIINKL